MLYKPGDKVQFRVLVLNSDTKPYQFSDALSVDIIDSHGCSVFKEKISAEKMKHAGVHVGEYQILETQLLGSWKIEARIDKFHVTEKAFKVSKKSLPKFRAVIETESHIIVGCGKIRLTVFGEYSFGDFVTGQVEVTVKSFYINDLNTAIVKRMKSDKILAKKTFEFDLKEDLYLDAPGLMTVELKVQEKLSKKTVNETFTVQVHATGEYNIELVRLTPKLKAGSPFELRAIVRNYKGLVESTRTKVKFTIISPIGVMNVEKKLVDGIADLKVEAPESLSGLTITAKYHQSTAMIQVEKVAENREFLIIKSLTER